ncbi:MULTISPECIES: SDR family oxidoreductase [unclassified Nocardioides]|uniref:SDR family oxidoreductase n=1 Tax=unclassified Nocardioides TaxID=2615069 RepID=UPI0006F96345|nr:MULTISPECIES: SDR family oxidoreductase [unclassified Nocardioides]KQY54275.1 short-chain dehydrogenase [Nocardioides sp. Root140]KQZ74897.1 short-chain dehydrogenase [Nocardioides sp. Root151]KRF10431.1 short-chain dehydrogenase [Nocardioides sp. Soil796]
MSALNDRVVVITGAGRGIGRAHALFAAEEGAKVVVNDIGAGSDGRGSDGSVAAAVVDEITAAGGTAVGSTADVRTMAGAQELLDLALATYGRVDGLVNNAGVLRDKMFANMSEDDWDAVIEGQLKATFAPSRIFAAHWRDESKAGRQPSASLVNVPSTSGLIGAVGQTNYGAAKAGIAALTVILAQELGRYGVRVNAVTPVARTRMTEDLPKIGEMVAAPTDPSLFDVYHPGNVSPLVGWLLTEGCPENGSVWYAKGGEIRRFAGWSYEWTVDKGQRWTIEELDHEIRSRSAQAADAAADPHN